jgi:nucleoid-associated protein YgaU
MNSSNSAPAEIKKDDIASSSQETSTEKDTKEVASEIPEPMKEEPSQEKQAKTESQIKKDNMVKDTITKEIQNIASSTKNSNGKMSPEDIANIVQLVMQKMNQEKNKENKNSSDSGIEQSQDKELVKSLTNSEVDSLASDNIDDALTEIDKSKQASSSATPNTYNKVVLENKTDSGSDELSKLSAELSSVIGTDDTAQKDNTGYTKSIAKEVKTRKKEMRYITVKKGDTLGKIAKKVYGNVMDYKKIYEANPDILRRPDRIYIGQKLRIPE